MFRGSATNPGSKDPGYNKQTQSSFGFSFLPRQAERNPPRWACRPAVRSELQHGTGPMLARVSRIAKFPLSF
jgi:hypothetical protein